jgi:hypothetical protein
VEHKKSTIHDLSINPLHPPLNDVAAAKFLGVAVQTLRNWRGLSRGPAYLKLSPGPRGRVGYLIQDLNAYRAKCRINTGDANHLPISSDNLIEKDAHKADM